jgi:nicotinamidase-related amidase
LPLSKKYGWGAHFDADGKIAIYPDESTYQRFVKDKNIRKFFTMRSKNSSDFDYWKEVAMATVRDGGRSVLVIVDMQRAVLRNTKEPSVVVENVGQLVLRARAEKVPVIWAQHSDEQLTHGSSDWEFVPELVPETGEPVIHNHYNSAFEETDIEHKLAEFNASHIVLAGAATNWCIRATAYGALDRGYDLTLVEDGHTTGDQPYFDGKIIEADNLIMDLNVAMEWVTYPGRTSCSRKASEISFVPTAPVPPVNTWHTVSVVDFDKRLNGDL